MRLTRQAVVSGPPAEPDVLLLRLFVGQLSVDAIGRRFWANLLASDNCKPSSARQPQKRQSGSSKYCQVGLTTCRRPRFEPGQRGGGLGGTSYFTGSARHSAHTGRGAKPGSARHSASDDEKRWRANSRDQRGSKLHTTFHCCQISSIKNSNRIPTKSCIYRTGQLASITFLHLLSTELLCLS